MVRWTKNERHKRGYGLITRNILILDFIVTETVRQSVPPPGNWLCDARKPTGKLL